MNRLPRRGSKFNRCGASAQDASSGPSDEPLRVLARLLARQAARESFAHLEISDKAPPEETS
jgi:hypothetical protein